MDRTPDEIKKGLECCKLSFSFRECGSRCPYFRERSCGVKLFSDALALIQQLEAERDAAVEDIRLASTSYVGMCQTCKHCKNQVDCDEQESCGMCKIENCPCRTCGKEDRNWDWRGVQKEGEL